MIRTRPEDHASVADAFAALKDEGGGELFLTDRYPLPSDALIDFDNVSINGHGPGCGFVVTSENATGGVRAQGAYPGATNIPQDIGEWADSATLVTADFVQNDSVVSVQDATALSVEDYIVIQASWKAGGYKQWHTNQVIGKSGSVLSLAAPIAFSAGLSYADIRVFKIAPLKNLRFANFSIWNESGSPNVHGLVLNCVRDSVIEGVVGHGFSQGRAISAGVGINNNFLHYGASKSGQNNPYSDLYLWGQTLAQDFGSRSYRAAGFGQCWFGVNQSVIVGPLSCRANGRGQKFFGSHMNMGGEFLNVAPLYTGLALSFYSSRNVLNGVASYGAIGGPGVWFADTYNYNNLLVGVAGDRNGIADLAIYPTDGYNAVFGLRGTAYYPTPNGSKITQAWP